MSKPIVNFVISNSHNVRSKKVHNLNGGDPFKLTVDERPSEHITRDCINDVRFFVSDLADIAGEH